MPPTPRTAYASVEVFDDGQDERRMTDRGFAWTDFLHKTHNSGNWTCRADGMPHLEYIPEIGLVCRPFLVPKDTRKSLWNTVSSHSSTDTWQETKPSSGVYSVYRLHQYDNSADITWSATSYSTYPSNCDMAVSLILPDSPNNWDYVDMEPYVRIEMGYGTNKWAVLVTKQGGFLLRMINGNWISVKKLSLSAGRSDLDEIFVYIRFIRGKIAISFDFGESYQIFGIRGYSILVPDGPLTIAGQGGQCAFGVHQLYYYQGRYYSQTRDCIEAPSARLLSTPTITGFYGGNLDFDDESSADKSLAAYSVLFSPSQRSAPGLDLTYSTPYLATTVFSYPFQSVTTTSNSTFPWDPYILAVDLHKPLAMDGTTCTIQFHHNAFTAFTGNYRWKKVKVTFGYKMSDGTSQVASTFIGHIRSVHPHKSSEFGQVVVRVIVDNVSIRFKRTEWNPMIRAPLSGQTGNSAATWVFASEGIDTGRLNFHAIGDSYALPVGSFEEPMEMTRSQEKKWSTLKRVFGYYGLDLVPRDDGEFETIPYDYVSSSVDWEFYSTRSTSTDIREQLEEYGNSYDASQSSTAVMVYSQDEYGQGLYGIIKDSYAEDDPASGRFSYWREMVQEEIQGTTNLGIVNLRTQALAVQWLGQKFEPELTIPVHPGLSRRMRVAINGCTNVGIPNGQEYVILTLHHEYRARSTVASLKTRVGVRRL